MTAKEHHVVTGATGYVGSAIVLELLAETNATVSCLVRQMNGDSPRARLDEALSKAAIAYDRPDLVDEIGSRVRVLLGDITAKACGSGTGELAALDRVDQVWHSAASLAFEDQKRETIMKHNVEGTRNVIDLARGLGTERFNYISTAYVAGEDTGWIPPAPVRYDDDAVFRWNNWYERSKVCAEELVLDAGFELTRIFRPSVVIGHSSTFATTSRTGLYGFIEGLSTVRREVRQRMGDLLAFRPLRIRAAADAKVNMIPVDRVAKAAVSIAKAGDGPDIYHLANQCQVSIGESFSLVAQRLGMKSPVYVSDSSEFTLIDETMDEQFVFYRSYMQGTKDFDLTNTEKIVGESTLNVSLSPQEIMRYIDWYLENDPKVG